MKRGLTAVLILLVTLPLAAQVSLGARHGAAAAFTYMEYATWRIGAVNLLQLIVPYESIGIQFEAVVIPEVFEGEGVSDVALSSLAFPILLRFPVDVPGPDWLGLTAIVGPRILFRFAGSSGAQDLGWGDLYRWDVGAAVGVEMSAAIGMYTISLEIRAAAGVFPIARGYQARSLTAGATLGYRVTFPPRPAKEETDEDQPAS